MYNYYSNQFRFGVKVNNQFTKEYISEGKTYIEGRKGSEYSLYFRNNLNKRVLVVFSVDGLSVLDGKTASKQSGGYVLDAWGEVEVPGWKIDRDTVGKFKFSPKGDRDKSYVEQLESAGFNVDVENQGVIGCMVFEEKEYVPVVWTTMNGPIYMAASASASPSAKMSRQRGHEFIGMSQMERSVPDPEPSLGTGFGENKAFHTTQVSFERKSTEPVWTGVLYYDTILNLKKKGVIIERKEPDPFPGSNGCYVPKKRYH